MGVSKRVANLILGVAFVASSVVLIVTGHPWRGIGGTKGGWGAATDPAPGTGREGRE